MRSIRLIFTWIFAVVTVSSSAVAEEYYDIGPIHHDVTTESSSAQQWFDRGLANCYGFNHEEAVRCFEKAIAADPGMAMAYWGMAYAMGPNINNMEIEAHQIAKADLAVRLCNSSPHPPRNWKRN